MPDFDIPPETIALWTDAGTTPATESEIKAVAALAGASLPDDYVGFLRSHGFVEWDIDVYDSFSYDIDEGAQTIRRTASIAHLEDPASLARIMAYARADDPARGLPAYPAEMFPIGGTAGSDAILMELSPQRGRIWFWPDRSDPWGRGDNKTLGYVAPNFAAFVSGLRLEADV